MPFLTLLLGNWKLLLLGSLLLVLGIQTWRLDRCQKQAHDYRVSVEALGRAQQLENARILAQREKLSKEVTDAKDKAISDLSVKYARARLLNNPRSGAVPSSTEAPILASACQPTDNADRRLEQLEAALLDALEKADKEIIKYRALWVWANQGN